jgi:hypothetical protein
LKNLKALAYWIQDNRRRGITSESTEFTVVEMHLVRDRMLAVEGSRLGDVENNTQLSKVDPHKFKQSKLEFINYLKSRKGCTTADVSLAYVIRADNADPEDAADNDKRMMLQAPITGVSFDRDNKVVYMKAELWTIGTDAYSHLVSGSSGKQPSCCC